MNVIQLFKLLLYITNVQLILICYNAIMQERLPNFFVLILDFKL